MVDCNAHFPRVVAVFSIISCVLLWITALLNCVAFGTREMLVSDGYSPFVKIGFFMACFDRCGRPYCPVGDDDMYLDKCYNLWPWFQDDYYIQEQWDWLTPEWFKTCRTLVIVNIPLTFISAFTLTISALIALAERDTEEPDQKIDTFLLITLYVAAGLNLLSATLGIFSVSHFYANAFMRDFMPMPHKNHLGFSYYLEVVCCAFLVLSGILCLFAAMFKTILVLDSRDESKYDESTALSR